MFDSFRYATARPVDARYVVETTDDAIKCDLTYYHGCVTYITRVDTFVLHNQSDGTVIQPIIQRQKIMNLLPFFKELKFRKNPDNDSYPLCSTDEDINTLDLDEIYKIAFNTSDNKMSRLYLDLEYDYHSNADNDAKGFTIFNKYMRGYDCIMDFEHNVFVSKTIKPIYSRYNSNDIRYDMCYKLGHIFDKNGGLNVRLTGIYKQMNDQKTVIKNISDTLATVSEILNRIKDKVFVDNTDTESKQLITSLDSHINTVVKPMTESLMRTLYNKDYTPYNTIPEEEVKINPIPSHIYREYEYSTDRYTLEGFEPSVPDHL